MIKLEFLKGTHTESQPLESDLSFEEICPIWSQKFKNGIYLLFMIDHRPFKKTFFPYLFES